MKLIQTVLEYFTHASTWKGIVAMLTAAGVTVAPEMADKAIALGLSLVGFIQIFIDDHDQNNLDA